MQKYKIDVHHQCSQKFIRAKVSSRHDSYQRVLNWKVNKAKILLFEYCGKEFSKRALLHFNEICEGASHNSNMPCGNSKWYFREGCSGYWMLWVAKNGKVLNGNFLKKEHQKDNVKFIIFAQCNQI